MLIACNDANQIANPYPSLKTDLGEKSFAVLAIDKTKNDRLLGILKFNQATQSTIEGSWRLETWRANDVFSFPVNTREKFPMVADLGSLSGNYFGTLLLINIELPEMGNSLAILIEKYYREKLVFCLNSVLMVPLKP